MQRSEPLPVLVAGCPNCCRQPRHITRLGKGTHSIECGTCQIRTPPAVTRDAALAAWGGLASISCKVRSAA